MLKNKCCLYVIISIRFFSITICNLLIEFPSYKNKLGLILCANMDERCGYLQTSAESGDRKYNKKIEIRLNFCS